MPSICCCYVTTTRSLDFSASIVSSLWYCFSVQHYLTRERYFHSYNPYYSLAFTYRPLTCGIHTFQFNKYFPHTHKTFSGKSCTVGRQWYYTCVYIATRHVFVKYKKLTADCDTPSICIGFATVSPPLQAVHRHTVCRMQALATWTQVYKKPPPIGIREWEIDTYPCTG